MGNGLSPPPLAIDESGGQVDLGKTPGHQEPSVVGDDANGFPSGLEQLLHRFAYIRYGSVQVEGDLPSSFVSLAVDISELSPAKSRPNSPSVSKQVPAEIRRSPPTPVFDGPAPVFPARRPFWGLRKNVPKPDAKAPGWRPVFPPRRLRLRFPGRTRAAICKPPRRPSIRFRPCAP